MSSRCRSTGRAGGTVAVLGWAGLAALLTAAAAACNRGAQGSEPAAPETGAIRGMPARATAGVMPGIHPAVVLGNLRNPYTGNTDAIATGRQLFKAYNCAGCHSSYAGGGMGPNLRDSLWRFGNRDADLYSTIVEGRAGGMPAWGAKIPEDQIWKIIAYIRTLGTPAEPEKPPTPARSTGAPSTPPGSNGGSH